MLAAIMASGMFCSCEEEKTPEENAYELLLDKRGPARIEKIYSIVMRLDIPYPFPHYVFRFDNGDNTYFRKSKVDYTLRAGDRVDYYWTYKLAPAEIYELCSEQGAMRQDDIDGSSKPLARGLIISDKKRGRIVDMFRMSVRFGIPFVPLDCLFAELEDGSLVYMKEYKNDDLHDPLINDYHAVALKLATWDEIDTIKKYAFQVNDFLKKTLAECGVTLVDFKLEFGKTSDGTIVLADEISPDTCRFWDSKTGEKLDKDRFRRDLGNVEGAYQEMARRLMGK